MLVRGERIAAVGPANDVSAGGARVIDLPGMTLLPGLIDAHSHLLLHPYNEAPWDDQVLRHLYSGAVGLVLPSQREGTGLPALEAALKGGDERVFNALLAHPLVGQIEYARARGIPVEAKLEKPYSVDDNLFGRSIEAGILEDPWASPPEDAFVLTAAPANAPPPVDVVIAFEQGLPVALDGEELELHELVAAVNEHAGPYGIGRIDLIENRAIGIKSRELYEAPAAITLIAAHQALEDIVLTKAELVAKRELEPKWAKLVYDGLWFSPLREAYDAFIDATQELVTGEVRVTLSPGAPVVAGRRSPNALYAETLASYGVGETFPHSAAEGFIRLAALEVDVAPPGYRDDLLVCLGLAGKPSSAEEVHAAACRLATGVMELVKSHVDTFTRLLPPQLSASLADGSLHRYTAQVVGGAP